MANVKIALRVRPLSEKEIQDEKSSKMVVVAEDDKTVSITNLKVPASNAGDSRERVKRFSFDFCFDSSTPTRENYATQEMIYKKLGAIVLESIARGQDACVLAYGQSSSGKTHTMQGTSSQPGLAPRLCEALMLPSNEDISEATVSYFEIYNERVRDLLTRDDLQSIDEGRPSSVVESTINRSIKDLRVREHPKNGPYVEGLSGIVVQSGRQLSGVVSLGASRRRTAATAGNATSSRSHSLLSIQKNNTTLTLLDLAGSERPSRVNQSIPRQKEGSSINKSLVALANVISALAYAGPRVVSRYVPYRDSVLTWLLKDTLAGRTTTVMIATVSPSCCCYSETVNTMRWAARASRIPASSNANANPGTSRITDSPHEKAIRLLRAEVTRLRELLREATSKTQIPAPLKNKSVESSNIEDPDKSLTFDLRSETDDGCEISEVSETTIKEEKEIGDQSRETEAGDSLNSLASSRISVASNDTLSGNNSIPSTQGSNLNSSQAEDALFGPRLHRTGSVHDVKPLLPLRNKKRQYRSHEVLPSLDKYPTNKYGAKPVNKTNRSIVSKSPPVPQNNPQTDKPIEVVVNQQSVPTTPDASSKNEADSHQTKTHFPYEPFNKRADIVASVTDRLYTTLKKKDEVALINKPEPSIIERRNSQSLSELRICSNARKRLFDFSHRALRMSRRLRIGIAVETQTDKISAVRVKEVAIDTQRDIEPFQNDFTHNEKQFRNASIGTEKNTLLCKEASVGTTGGSIRSNDKSIETDKLDEIPNITITRTCGNMTENVISSYSASTQTSEPIPPRKKCSSFTKYLKVTHDPPEIERIKGDRLSPTVLNISISHDCGPFENEIDGISDDSLESENKQPSVKITKPIIAPPDLLNNHNSTENLTAHGDPCCSHSPQPNFSVSNTRSMTENHSKTVNKNNTTNHDNNIIGGLIPSAGVIDENKFTSECRDNVKLTNADGAIKNETECDINQRCDRVSGAPGEVIKEPAVTRSVLQSAILKTDTVNPGANNGIGGQNRENPSRENKSIQVGPPRDVFTICGDFLDEVYVPLPRTCVNSEYGIDGWPNMRNLIMGRNENIYPYNIKTSPRKMEKKKFAKSVTWKSDDGDTIPSTTYGKSIMKKAISSPSLESSDKSDDTNEIHGSPSNPYDNKPELQKNNDDTSFNHNIDDSRSFGKGSKIFDNFKGIHCWNDRSPAQKRESRLSKYRHDYDSCRSDTKRCLQYVEATSNFLVEATNLVTALNKSTNKLNESGTCVKKSISPVCNERLQIDDENRNTYHSIDYIDRNINSLSNYTSPSQLIRKKKSAVKRSLVINDSLVDIDEHTKEQEIQNGQMNSASGPMSVLNDLKFLENGSKVEDAEKKLLDSLDRLGNCTKRTSEYFSTIKTRYSRQFNVDHHHSLPSNLNEGTPPLPYPRHRRSPSRYLQQLLELRKELVQSTKRDDDIFKHFQVR